MMLLIPIYLNKLKDLPGKWLMNCLERQYGNKYFSRRRHFIRIMNIYLESEHFREKIYEETVLWVWFVELDIIAMYCPMKEKWANEREGLKMTQDKKNWNNCEERKTNQSKKKN